MALPTKYRPPPPQRPEPKDGSSVVNLFGVSVDQSVHNYNYGETLSTVEQGSMSTIKLILLCLIIFVVGLLIFYCRRKYNYCLKDIRSSITHNTTVQPTVQNNEIHPVTG